MTQTFRELQGQPGCCPSLARDRYPSTVSGFDVALSVYANSARGEWAW
jgi:hypothetical protein